ncbi:MAG: hypothetical protein WBL05_12800 [Brooklawnia sp.]|uniref:hypothetical protein n=1 Tax=Brooklawnia sp. TaxID=2699740 RepID=UPI003C74F8FC
MTPPPDGPPEELGVLLPLQLETKFRQDDPDRPWRMLLRVIPQPPAIDSHSDHLTPDEIEAVRLFRDALNSDEALQPDWFGTPDHRRAFAELAERVGPARATWLAQHAPRSPGEQINPADEPAMVRGLPARLRVAVWTHANGAEQLQSIGDLPNDPDNPDATIAPELPLPRLDAVDSVLGHWVADWPEAVRVGLGGEFELPDGLGPADLRGVCVWGIGDEAAATLFEHQIWTGALAEAPLGVATNSVGGATTATSLAGPEGRSTADGAPDEEAWWQALLRRIDPANAESALDRVIHRSLTGTTVPSIARPRGREAVLAEAEVDENVLGLFAGDAEAIRSARASFPAGTRLAPLLHIALWPALWGARTWGDRWGQDGDAVERLGHLGRWTLQNVNPQGPLPALRLHDEPYGLLPITRLDAWAPTSDDPPDLESLVDSLRAARTRLHAELVTGGTVRGADAARYAELLGRGGRSLRFGLHRWIDLNTVRPVLADPGRYRVMVSGEREWLESSAVPDPVELPLVQGTLSTVWGEDEVARRVPLPALLETILAGGRTLMPSSGNPIVDLTGLFSSDERYFGETEHGRYRARLRVLTDSLLARLLVQAGLTVSRWHQVGVSPPLGAGFEAEGWPVAALQVAGMVDPDDPAEPLRWTKPAAWLAVPNGDPTYPKLWGSYLPAIPPPTIDSARRKRLEDACGALLDTYTTRIDPWLTGVAWQRLRAASDGQARHRLGAYGWVYGPFEGRPGPTDSGLLHTPSQAQTLVATLARDEYLNNRRHPQMNEQGEPPWGIALTGSAVRIATELVADLRDGHHLYEVVGREVERIVATPAESPYLAAEQLRQRFPMYPDRPDPRQVCQGVAALESYLAGEPVPVPVSTGQLDQLRELQAGIDALADIALLDGALNSSSRRPGRAAASMRGVSGSGPFPEPEYPRTPASGRELWTTVLSVIPWREPEPDATAAGLAEPSVAALLEQQFGTGWTWRVDFSDGTQASVLLDTFGLRPIDTVALAPAQLRLFAAAACGVQGVPTGRQASLGPSGAGELFEPTEPDGHASAVVVDPPALATAARLCALLGGPATDATWATTALLARYGQLKTEHDATVSRLLAATQAGASHEQQVAAVRLGARWGLTPLNTPADTAAVTAAVGGLPQPDGATPLAEILAVMAGELEQRAAGVDPTGGADSIARAVATLAAPQGNLPVLVKWPTSRLLQTAELTSRDPTRWEGEWLTVVAPTRPALARLEAYQLAAEAAGGEALTVWANSGDPWLTEEIAELIAFGGGLGGTPPGYACAVGPGDALAGEDVAVGVVDAYAEVLPLRRRDTHAAFGFNAPLARAPQAILIAVPPNAGDRLTDDDVAVMLTELRALLVARAATASDRVDEVLPTGLPWLGADEAVRLFDPATRFMDL